VTTQSARGSHNLHETLASVEPDRLLPKLLIFYDFWVSKIQEISSKMIRKIFIF
jgi:hypothetical protein